MKKEFVNRVLKNAKDKNGSVKYTNKKDFLEMIKDLPTESLSEYKNAESIKDALKRARKQYPPVQAAWKKNEKLRRNQYSSRRGA